MTPVPVLDGEGLAAGRTALAEAVATTPIKQHLIHETVVAELAARRAGTHATRNRARVSGGGKKPWRQKGTGRARQGSTRAPQWTGGGIVFGPTPRAYGGKVNRKIRLQAFGAALRAHADRGSAAIMEATGWDAPSTKRALEYLRQAPDGLQVRPLLVVVADLESVESRSFRNLPGVYVLTGSELETVDIVAARAILVERAVWERLTGEVATVETVSPAPTRKPAPTKTPPPAPKPLPVEEAPAPEEAAEGPAGDPEQVAAGEAQATEAADAPQAEDVAPGQDGAEETADDETPGDPEVEASAPRRARSKADTETKAPAAEAREGEEEEAS